MGYVSSRPWPGDAALNVSMVNWVKAQVNGPHQLVVEDDAFSVDYIPTHLQLHADVSETRELSANTSMTAMGVIFGTELFRVERALEPPMDYLLSRELVRPVAAGTALLKGQLERAPAYCIYFGDYDTESDAFAHGGEAFALLQKRLKAYVQSVEAKYPGWSNRWWQPLRPQTEFFSQVRAKMRFVACSSPQARPIFAFISTKFIPTNTLQVFAFDDDYSFGVIQSSLHWAWTKAKGGKVRADIRYTSAVWTTFPWPQEPNEEEVVVVANAARNLRRVRDQLMKDNGWSLRALYQASEVPGPHPLKEAQAALDEAVQRAYGMPGDQDATEFLFELNQLVAEDEAEGRAVQGPGIPRGLDPKDPRLNSMDCIEPPKL
jgi:hypothetical protein